jgi:hypothetical protein
LLRVLLTWYHWGYGTCWGFSLPDIIEAAGLAEVFLWKWWKDGVLVGREHGRNKQAVRGLFKVPE